MTKKKPEETTIDEGLTKLYEAIEELTEQQRDVLAQAARDVAQESRRKGLATPAATRKNRAERQPASVRFSHDVASMRLSIESAYANGNR